MFEFVDEVVVLIECFDFYCYYVVFVVGGFMFVEDGCLCVECVVVEYWVWVGYVVVVEVCYDGFVCCVGN